MITTLAYITKDEHYLMLYRNKKENDPNKGKWVGVGGKVESQESPDECMIREVKEEAGLNVKEYENRGLITFCYNDDDDEHMHLYTVTNYDGQLIDDCAEGELSWVPINEVNKLNLWQGDILFLDELETNKTYFTMKLIYKEDKLVQAYRNGERIL